MEDKELIEKSLKGNENAKKMLYENNFKYCYFHASKYLKDKDDIMEVVNDSFIKFFSNLDKYNSQYSIRTWLIKIITNTALDYLRKIKGLTFSLDETYDEKFEFNDDDAISKITVKEIMELINKIPKSYSVVFNLFVIENYSHEEISEKLGISVGASKSNLFKARLKLKELLIKNL